MLAGVPVIGVAEHTPGAVVKLNVAAACFVQFLNDGAVSGGNILHQLLHVRINRRCLDAVVLAIQFGEQLRRCRYCLLDDGIFIFELLHEFEMLDKRMIFAADFAGHFDRTRCGFLAVKEVTVIQLDFLDTVESPHKVQMPIAAAKFAVCDGVITGSFFLCD